MSVNGEKWYCNGGDAELILSIYWKEQNKSTVSKMFMFSNWVTEQIMRKILSYLEGLR